MNLITAERKGIAEYLTGRSSMILLLTAGVLITAAQLLNFFAAGAGVEQALLSLRDRNHPSQWFVGMVLAFSAVVSMTIASASANRRDRATWKGMALFLTLISAAQVVSLRDFFGWSYLFSTQGNTVRLWWTLLGGIAAAGLAGGYFLQQSLRDSTACIKPVFFGTLLYVTGAMGDAVMLSSAVYGAEYGVFAKLQFVLNILFKTTGIAVFFYGLILHEDFLRQQLRRVTSGRDTVTLPAAKTEAAAWALRMIGTPTRDESLMREEVARAKKQEAKSAR